MAQVIPLALSIAGSYLGGAAGTAAVGFWATAAGQAIAMGVGGAIGGMIGQAIVGGDSQQGPRAESLKVQGSAYGSHIPIQHGINRLAGQIIWAPGMREIEHD